MIDSNSLLTFSEVKNMLRISATTLYGLLRADAIKHYKVGGKYLIPADAVQAFLHHCEE